MTMNKSVAAMGTAAVRAADRLGLTPEEYVGRAEDGLLFCCRCREWHDIEKFSKSPTRPSGYAPACRTSTNAARSASRNPRRRVAIRSDLAGFARRVTRFWQLVAISEADSCWPWRGRTDRDGYGLFDVLGLARGAHELAVTFTTGQVRGPDLDTLHRCDNPPCCNPAHLRFGTRLENVTEMRERGRAPVGSRRGYARLDEDRVLEIRSRATSGTLHRILAAEYGVSRSTISDVVAGRKWRHVAGPPYAPASSSDGEAAS